MTIFLLIVTFLIFLMAVFIILFLFIHRKREILFKEKLITIQSDYERNLLKSQLEIQEQTFQHISREIHDNISLSLTLAKLHLNTVDWNDKIRSDEKVSSSIELLTESIKELSDISKSLNADIIIQHGLLKAIENEMDRIRQTGLFTLNYEINGSPIYLDHQKELIVFRIIQEAFNNIIKHAAASKVELIIKYDKSELIISVNDNGRGFDPGFINCNRQAGLTNMDTRIKILNGKMLVDSKPGKGTTLLFTILLD